jgi:hypothetical protein
MTLILLNIGPKHKISDTGNFGLPYRSHEVLPLKEKVKVPNLIKKEKKLHVRLLRSMVKNPIRLGT